MGTAQGIINSATSYLGYKSQGINPFNEWYGWTYYQPWCDVFVCKCAEESGNGGAVGKYAYCPSHVNFFANKCRWLGKITNPQAGDIIFFTWDGNAVADHVGIVTSCDGSRVYTIEGNTNSYPGEVTRQSYPVTSYVILGYGRPSYDGSPSPTPTPIPSSNINVYYKVKTTESGWLPEVKNLNDYAGLPRKKITDIAIRVDQGSMYYQVHVLGGGWLPKVTGYNTGDFWNGYAGNGKPIDCIKAYIFAPNADKVIRYRVAPVGQGYYDWQEDIMTSKGQDGYAGAYGKAIDKFQASIGDYRG